MIIIHSRRVNFIFTSCYHIEGSRDTVLVVGLKSKKFPLKQAQNVNTSNEKYLEEYFLCRELYFK